MPRIPAPVLDLHRQTLDNGLRVVLAPDPSAPVVAVAVHYDVGFRSEPVGRTGFAHLFEHLMFQGSESLEKLAHFRHVQGSGGVFNGSTHQDYTDYFEVLPAAALERALFLEADRMRAPTINEENLRNQVDVVKEEIRLNVLNRPYGGFPWILLPPVLYDTFANSHNGYGDFTDLEQATVEDCAAFFDAYYAPGNAVLTVCGDFDLDTGTDLVAKHFGDVPKRAVPKRPSFHEPEPDRERRSDHADPLAPLPALAVGYRLPDPDSDLAGYTRAVLLSSVLSDGDASRLPSRLVHRDAIVTDVGAGCGFFSAFDARDPDTMTVTAVYPTAVETDRVLAAIDDEIATVARDGVSGDELSRTVARWSAAMFRDHDRLVTRTRAIGVCELLHGRGELAAELPALLAGMTSDDVAAAAEALKPDARAVLTITPGAGSKGPAQ
ncbi:MAG TPA: pitrilysin family protein [Pseudonocardiaceae bacterium]|nr:pitrilysin family protein [Pseudonocardiaceae bacterium]